MSKRNYYNGTSVVLRDVRISLLILINPRIWNKCTAFAYTYTCPSFLSFTPTPFCDNGDENSCNIGRLVNGSGQQKRANVQVMNHKIIKRLTNGCAGCVCRVCVCRVCVQGVCAKKLVIKKMDSNLDNLQLISKNMIFWKPTNNNQIIWYLQMYLYDIIVLIAIYVCLLWCTDLYGVS